MLRLLADENFNGNIVCGLLRRKAEMDAVRVQDVGLSGADDRIVLAWAANGGRVLLTHDQKTVPTYAYGRVMAGLPMPNVFLGDTYLPVQQAIEDILLLVVCSEEHEWEGQVRYRPLLRRNSQQFLRLFRPLRLAIPPLSAHMNVEYQ